MTNNSDRNGKAFEYCLAKTLSKIDNFYESSKNLLINHRDKEKFDRLPEVLKHKFKQASNKISKWVDGKFFSYVSQIVLSYSLAHLISNPAFSKPRSNPPAPEKRDTNFIKLILIIYCTC